MIESLRLPRGARVLDAACGTGAAVMLLARRWGADAVGLDFSAENVERARRMAGEAGLGERAAFVTGDVADLPFDDGAFDAVLCECAVSTFADAAAAARELARVLKPGGQLGMSDMAVHGALSERLMLGMAPWTCLAHAMSVEGYQRLFLDSGLRVVGCDDESAALVAMGVDLKRKLVMAGLGQLAGVLPGQALDVQQARGLIDEGLARARDGTVQYVRVVFSKGVPRRTMPWESGGCDPSTGCC